MAKNLNYIKSRICKACGGRCCNGTPGTCHLSDFKDRNHILETLRGGRYCLAWWEGDPRDEVDELDRAYFIRPAGKGLEGKLLDPTWGDIGCTFLTAKGCELEGDKRPKGCRLLEPMPSYPCRDHSGGKKEAAISWLQHDLESIIEEVSNRGKE